MNDCVWCFIFCECNSKCERYLSANCQEGSEFLRQYEKEIDEAIEPVKKKYQEKFAANSTQTTPEIQPTLFSKEEMESCQIRE
jgi:hypothetical protein